MRDLKHKAVYNPRRKKIYLVPNNGSSPLTRKKTNEVNWEKVEESLKEMAKDCSLPTEKLGRISEEIAVQLYCPNPGGRSRIKTDFSNVEKLPNGSERGLFYGVDLRGSKFLMVRVYLGEKEGERVVKHESEEVDIPRRVICNGWSEDLFDLIATSLAKFVSSESGDFTMKEGKTREIGVTCAFPMKQGSLLEGQDVVAELNKAIAKQGLDMKVKIVVNALISTLASERYNDKDVVANVSIATSTNANYVDQENGRDVVIHMEYGNFNSLLLPLMNPDEMLDCESLKPADEICKKMISGVYLGELIRRVLCKLSRENRIFGDSEPQKLKNVFILSTTQMVSMHHDTSPDLKIVGEILEEVLDICSISFMIRKLVVDSIDMVAKRAARLAAGIIYAIMKKLGCDNDKQQRTVIIVDRGIYKNYTIFNEIMEKTLKELVGEEGETRVVVKLANDGASIGAAMLAASHSEYHEA